MAINLTTLFTKLGHAGGILNSLNTYRGTTVPSKFATLYTDYTGSSDEATIDGTMTTLSSWQASSGSVLSSLRSLAKNTIINTVNADILQPDNSLSTAMNELIAEMIAASATVKASVVGINVAATGGNDGNPSFVTSLKTNTGLTLENIYAETLVATCTVDAQTGGSNGGSEQITLLGQQAQTDPLNWNYPEGSASTTTLTVVDASLNEPGGSSQWLVNGDFETWTVSNVPDGWHITVGTAGTQVVKSSVPYAGTYSLGLVGDSSTLTAVEQEFAIDNTNAIAPLTQYAFNFWVKGNSVPASGVLEVALVDGGGTIIQDTQGTNNSLTKNLTTLTTSFVAVGGTFRTPRLLPITVYLRVRFSTTCPSGSTVYIDRLAFTKPVQLYQGGPYLAGFSGNVNLIKGDSFSVTTTNTAGGFQQLFDKFFGMKGLQFLLPSSASPTISDSLIA